MNYRVAYNFLNVELTCPDVEATKGWLKAKGFKMLALPKEKPQDHRPPPLPNQLWMTYRYHFTSPLTEGEEPNIRVDRWWRPTSPVLEYYKDYGAIGWTPIMKFPGDLASLDKLHNIYNKPIGAGSIRTTAVVWVLCKREDGALFMVINNGAVGLVNDGKEVKKLRDLLDLADASSVVETERNIEVV